MTLDLGARRVGACVAVALPVLAVGVWPSSMSGAGFVPALIVGVAGLLGLVATLQAWTFAGVPVALAAGVAATMAAAQRPSEPEAALLGGLCASALSAWALGWFTPYAAEVRDAPAVPKVSHAAAVALALAGVVLRVTSGLPYATEAALVAAIPLLLGSIDDLRRARVSWWTTAATGALFAGACAANFVESLRGPEWSVVVALPTLLAWLLAQMRDRGVGELVFVSPARLLVVSFFFLCLIGTGLLAFGPAAQGAPIAVIDAAFTAVSATCVTGLSVIDTASGLSPFGEAVVLMLIQVGGLGIMTFSAAASVWTGRRLSLREEATAADLLGPQARRNLRGALGRVIIITAVVEGLTAAVLFVAFVRAGEPVARAAWRAMFTAISAFCNAGFALQSDSLVPYQNDVVVLGTVAVALVIGGIGPAVLAVTPRMVLRGGGPLHARVVWVTTIALIAAPSLLIAVLEWRESLAGLSPVNKVSNAVFQAVTLRTAGFNSVDLTAIAPATWTLMVFLMFIGGSPASTAGGIKTTTLATLVLATVAGVRGRAYATAFGWRLSQRAVVEAVSVVIIGLAAVLLALGALQVTQTLPLQVALFEVVSALGTVGLTVGGTGSLDAVGKVIIMLCMFAGRVGPLSIFVMLSERHAAHGRVPPEGTLTVG